MNDESIETKSPENGQLTFFPSEGSSQVRAEEPAARPQPTFAVNELQCFSFARQVPILISMRKKEDAFSLRHLDQLEQVSTLVHMVAICDRLNWDFTLGTLASNLWEITKGFSVTGVLGLDVKTFRSAFGNYKRPGETIGYSRRLKALHDVSRYSDVENIPNRLIECRHVGGDGGALALLQSAPIYNDDPLLKKANALLHELIRRRLVNFVDPESVQPAIDYHILRLYLRTGRIKICEEAVRQRLMKRQRMRIEMITSLRRVTGEAMRHTAWLARVPLSVLNDVEWAFARKACRRDEVWCAERKCPIAESCLSAYLSTQEMVTEPRSMHGHY